MSGVCRGRRGSRWTWPCACAAWARTGGEFGRTLNISRSGLLVAVPDAIQSGDAIDAIVQLSDATATVADVILRGQVTRVAYAGSLTEVAMTIDRYRLQRPHASVQ